MYGLPVTKWMGMTGLLIMTTNTVMADCISLVKGPTVIDVKSCRAVELKNEVPPDDPRLRDLAGLGAAQQDKLFGQYKGVILNAQVIKSDAVRTGFARSKQALLGESHEFFVPPALRLQCNALQGKRVANMLVESCCDGAAEAPCLLKTTYVLSEAKVIGASGSSAGDEERKRTLQSKAFQAGRKEFLKKTAAGYKAAAVEWEKAREQGALGVKGLYALGVAYRELDQCRRAIPPLEEIRAAIDKDRIWEDERRDAENARFLLARCYGRENEAEKAVVVLGYFLGQSKKYKRFLKESLRHPDLQYIKTTREFVDYSKKARAELK